MIRPVVVARRRGEDRRVELPGEEVGDHRLLQECSSPGEVLHVAEEMSHLQGLGPAPQHRPLARAEKVEPAPLVLGLDGVGVLLSGAVQERRLGLVEQLLQRGVHRQRRQRLSRALLHVGGGEDGRLLLPPLLADSQERLQHGARLLVRRRLRRRLGAGLDLLAPLRRGEHPLQCARRSEELRGRDAVEPEGLRPGGLRQPQQLQQIGADGHQREGALGAVERVLLASQLGGHLARELLGGHALHHLLGIQIDPHHRIRERHSVRLARAADQVARPSHPAQRLRGGLDQHASGRLECAGLAGGEARGDEEPGRQGTVDHPLHGLAQRDRAQDGVRLVRQGAQREGDEVGGGLVAIARRRLGHRPAQDGVQRAYPGAARAPGGDPGGHHAGVERRVQLGGFHERAAHVLPGDRDGRREGHRTQGLGIESVLQEELVELALLEQRPMAHAEQEVEVADRRRECTPQIAAQSDRNAEIGERSAEMEAQRPAVEAERVLQRAAFHALAQAREQRRALVGVTHAGHCSSTKRASNL